MKTDFSEDFVSENQDELDGKTVEIDFEAMDRALGFVNETVEDRDLPAMASAVKTLLAMIVEGEIKSAAGFMKRVAQRALMLAWVLDPGLLEGGCSISEVGRRLGVHKVELSKHSAEFRRRLKIQNRGSRHGWNFDPDKAPGAPSTHPDDIENDESNEDPD